MSELKPRITENGIDYILVGDYYIPDLKLPEERRPIGKYGRMHREYLREVHPARLNTLILTLSLIHIFDESCPEVDGVSYMPGVYKIPMVRIVDVSNLLTNPRMYGSISGLSRNA